MVNCISLVAVWVYYKWYDSYESHGWTDAIYDSYQVVYIEHGCYWEVARKSSKFRNYEIKGGILGTWFNVSIVGRVFVNADSSFFLHWKSKKLLCIAEKQVHG